MKKVQLITNKLDMKIILTNVNLLLSLSNLIFCSIAFESIASQSSISGSDLSALITRHLNTLGVN